MTKEMAMPSRARAADASHSSPSVSTKGDIPIAAWRDVLAERERQVSAEGWTTEHDDQHEDGELAYAAACYAAGEEVRQAEEPGWALWPWHADWWKPGADRRRQLVKAGALILAEIERLDRAKAKGETL